MGFPSITSASGVFTYYMAAMLAFTIVLAVYLVAVFLGLVPPPSEIPVSY